jgi:alpha-L-fucosidase
VDEAHRDVRSLQDGFGARGYQAGGWVPAPDDSAPWAQISFDQPTAVSGLVLREDIAQGQRLELVVITGREAHGDIELARVMCVGYQRLVRFAPRVVNSLTVRIEAARDAPRLRTVAVLAAW